MRFGTVEDMRRQMSRREYRDWVTFIRDCPLPQERTDYLLGSILAAILNLGKFSATSRNLTVDDVVPWFKPTRTRAPRRTSQQVQQAVIQADMAHWVAGFRPQTVT